jgi:glutamine---fructose-6-phosphate transaminase (isomerizing)
MSAAHSEGAFLSDIREQPAALERLLETLPEMKAAVRTIARQAPRAVRLVAHGSSANAATFGVYAFGMLPGWTAMRDSISLSVYYEAELDFNDSLVLGLSQSGYTPDVVAYVERARSLGALTVGLTNDPESPLASAAEIALTLSAGVERSLAATATYTNELALLALLAGYAAGRGDAVVASLRTVAELASEAMSALEKAARPAATAFVDIERMYVMGRGSEFATACEIALKLTETCKVVSGPLTTSELQHGPVVAVGPKLPVWAVASSDAVLPSVFQAAERIRHAGGALLVGGDAADTVEGAELSLRTPAAPMPLLAPLLSVLPGQLFACGLAEAKGIDIDRDSELTKVTFAL